MSPAKGEKEKASQSWEETSIPPEFLSAMINQTFFILYG